MYETGCCQICRRIVEKLYIFYQIISLQRITVTSEVANDRQRLRVGHILRGALDGARPYFVFNNYNNYVCVIVNLIERD